MEQSPAVNLRRHSRAHGRDRKDQPDEQRVQDDDAEIAWPAAQPPNLLPPPGSQHLPKSHGREHATECDETYRRFMGKQGFSPGHWLQALDDRKRLAQYSIILLNDEMTI